MARIEIAGIVMKRRSGHSWIIGRARPRKIKGRQTEEVLQPQYASTADIALPMFIGRVWKELKGELDGPDKELLDALSKARMGKLIPLLGAPEIAARDARGELGTRSFSQQAGIARSTLQEIEAGRSDPHCSTLLAILQASDAER